MKKKIIIVVLDAVRRKHFCGTLALQTGDTFCILRDLSSMLGKRSFSVWGINICNFLQVGHNRNNSTHAIQCNIV